MKTLKMIFPISLRVTVTQGLMREGERMERIKAQARKVLVDVYRYETCKAAMLVDSKAEEFYRMAQELPYPQGEFVQRCLENLLEELFEGKKGPEEFHKKFTSSSKRPFLT